jgi:hypothetical protein
MKCISVSWNSSDRDDVEFILKHLDLGNSKDVFTIIEPYYPNDRIPTKTQFLLEELLKRELGPPADHICYHYAQQTTLSVG